MFAFGSKTREASKDREGRCYNYFDYKEVNTMMCLQFCFNGCWLPDYKWWVMGKTLNVVQPQTKWWTQTSVFIHTGSLLLHKVV